MLNSETIAAVSTGLTESGIGIIRISGPESYSIAEKIFITSKRNAPDFTISHHVHYGYIVDYVSRETLDEVLLINMKGPHSYTGEDTIEIDCHGGVLMMQRILKNVLDAGAKQAEPGEFTKRAFLNGRLDLSRAEAVIDVINSKNEKAMQAAVSQLKGDLSEKIRQIRAVILEDTAYIEAALDDPEHIDLEGFSEKLSSHIKDAGAELEKLLASYENGRIAKEGINTVILGSPNAGKSSILNYILGEDRAIVTEIAGTTRDTIEEHINIGGLTLNIADTAGIRNTCDPIEKIGVDKAMEKAAGADLLLFVVDSSKLPGPEEHEIIDYINSNSVKTVIILNKQDLTEAVNEAFILNSIHSAGSEDIIRMSAVEKYGKEELASRINELFVRSEISYNDELILSSMRHKKLIENAIDSLKSVQDSVDAGMPEDFYTIDLVNAYTYLGNILGEDVDEDLVNEIFSKFCMGK